MKKIIREIFNDSASVKRAIAEDGALLERIASAAEKLVATVNAGGTIYTCGNGGSACDAMHFAEELVARYKRERPGIRAMHLLDPAILTCWSNDYDFETAIERQVKTFCTDLDLLVAISTSGNSPNIVAAARAAKSASAGVLALTGREGGKLGKIADFTIMIPADETGRIQEAHITLIHVFCEIIERELFVT